MSKYKYPDEKELGLIVNINFEKNYTRTPNSILRDKKLSLTAKGLFSILLSHGRYYKFSSERLANESSESIHTVQKRLRELESTGYLERKRTATYRMVYTLNQFPFGIKPEGYVEEEEENYEPIQAVKELDNDSDLTPLPLSEEPKFKDEVKEISKKNDSESLTSRIKKCDVGLKEASSLSEKQQIEVLYFLYPKHCESAQSRKEIKKAIKIAEFEVLFKATSEYNLAITKWKDKQFIPSPRKWFYGQQWDDDHSLWYSPEERDNILAPDEEFEVEIMPEGYKSPNEMFDAILKDKSNQLDDKKYNVSPATPFPVAPKNKYNNENELEF